MSISSDRYKENLKNATESLLTGGTLLAESCKKCNGVQIKKNDVITCIICGNITNVQDSRTTKDLDNKIQSDFEMSEKIRDRLVELIMSIGSDKNLGEEEQRLRVIDYYLKLLEKIRFLK
jgi:UPF0148 protein